MTGNNMDNFTDDASPKAGVPTGSGAVKFAKRCGICRGARTIRLPVWREPSCASLVGVLTGSEDLAASSRTYPCPECRPEVPFDQTAMESTNIEVHPEYIGNPEALRHIQEACTHRLVDRIISRGWITFTQRPSGDPFIPTVLTAKICVVSPVSTATLEQRITARQHEVAAEVVRNAKASIDLWGRDVGAEGLSKQMARVFLDEALRGATPAMKVGTPAQAESPGDEVQKGKP